MKIKADTLVRTACLALALVNNVLTMTGVNPLPFSDEDIYSGLSAVLTAAASLWAWWENNAFTKAAIMADEELERLKAEKTGEDEESGR